MTNGDACGTTKELKKPIIAQLGVIDEKNAGLEKIIIELGDRLSSALSTPEPKGETSADKNPTTCGIEERLCQIATGLNNRTREIRNIIERLQL